MKTIVATIQREQNRIIRSDNGRMLVVSGPAGCGKTSAALQRVAFLLYKYRKTLTAEQIVLFSPNPIFSRYISTVLPELGEENMEQTTLQEYLEHRLSRQLRLEDPFTQLEYVLTAEREPGYAARVAGIRFKSSKLFLKVMRLYKEALESGGLVFRDIKLKGRVLVSGERISEAFYADAAAKAAGCKLAPRLLRLVEWLDRELESAMRAERNHPWVADEVELLDPEVYRRVYNQLLRERSKEERVFNEGQRESELLREFVVRRHFRRLHARVKQLQFIDLPATYRTLFENPETVAAWVGTSAVPELWPEICAWTADRLDRGELPQEDAAPFLVLQDAVKGAKTNLNIRHVFIDEAQDYSPFQLEYIKNLFPRSRMTVLGDLNQAIFAHSSLPGFDFLAELYGPQETETIRLNRTYRSTRPIVEFTGRLLAGGEPIVPFNRDGELPTVTAAANRDELSEKIARRLVALRCDELGTVAVICKTGRESCEAHEALQPRLDLPIRLITKETAAFEPGLLVIPSYLAKGIEFDAVIVYNASRANYEREEERKLLYTVCTRAMHHLDLFYLGELSPLVAAAAPDTYVHL